MLSGFPKFHLGHCYELNCVPLNSYFEALTPKVTVFGDKAFKEVIKGGALIPKDCCPYTKKTH